MLSGQEGHDDRKFVANSSEFSRWIDLVGWISTQSALVRFGERDEP